MIRQTLHRINNRLFGRQSRASRSRNTRALAGGRVSMQDPLRSHTLSYVSPPERSRSVWQQKNWTEEELLNLPVDQFMKVVTSISPEVNKAYKDFLRNANESWGYQVEPMSATPVMDDFIARLETKHHDFDVLIDRVYAGIYKGGAIFWELELNESADMAVDIAVMDPYVARFERTGNDWRLGQWQKGKWVDLAEDPTVMYVPFNAGPNEPFGRSLMESAPMDVVRMLGVMNDFRRVLESQGWARADFEIDSERLKDFMPPEIIGDTEAEDAFIRDFINGVNQMYSNLKPNEGYGHLDIVKVNMPTGGQMNASFFGLVDGLMRLYDRRVGRATGSTPIKQHSNENVAETHAVEQRKDYRIDVSSIQSTTAGAFSTLFGYALRAEGVQGEVMFYFENTPDPADVKALAEAEGVKIDNLKKLKELQDMNGIDASTYQDAVNKYKSEKSKHAAGMRSVPSFRKSEGFAHGFHHNHHSHHSHGSRHICTDVNCDHPSHFEGVRAAGVRASKVTPDGADQPLPAIPSDFEINSAYLESAITTFEELFPDYTNLLTARVTHMSQTDAIETVRKGDWVWDDLKKTYTHSKTKKLVTLDDLLQVRDDFIDLMRDGFGSLTDTLVNSSKTVQEWLYEMRKRVRDIFSGEYMLPKGGRNGMYQDDLDVLKETILDQFGYLQDFAGAMVLGQLSINQINARSELYMEAATSSFERGRASSYGVTLPEYPGDGNQICGVRCRCRWHLVRSSTEVKAFWTLDPLAKHCTTCLGNAAKWAPYVVKIGG